MKKLVRILFVAVIILLPALFLSMSGKSAAGGDSGVDAITQSTPSMERKGMKRVTTDGGVTATWLSDEGDGKLMSIDIFPDAPDSLIDALDVRGGVPSSVSAFVVETDSVTMLFDTGMGAKDSKLRARLRHMGMGAKDIRQIFLTHFHADHIGGMMKGGEPVFPNAEIYASREEYEAWMSMPAEKNKMQAETMEAYKDRLHLFEYGDTLPGGVIALDARGHTPGHTAFQTGDLLVIGDLMHGAALQLTHPEINASFDMDKDAAAASRRRLIDYAKENGLTMAGMHLPPPAFIPIR